MTTQLYLKICEHLRNVIEGTKWEGHVFTVGGCCRDMVLGLPIHDVDLAVDLPNGGVEFAQWLHEQHLTTGRPTLFERYGTAMLRLRAFRGFDIEIVQTRAEKYTDRNSRNPETAFGSITDDCLRRDLTINSLYYDITNCKLLDITGRGVSDIKNRIIATPMEPDATYDDDPIRILRTVRFASRLGWELPVPVFNAMCRHSARLDIIKPERLRGEFEKILLSDNAPQALEMLRACGAMDVIIPEVVPTYSQEYLPDSKDTVWKHTLRTIGNLPANLELRYAALLADTALPYCINADKDINAHGREASMNVIQALTRLKHHSPFIKDVMFYCINHECAKEWGKLSEKMSDSALRRVQYLCGRPEKFDELLTLIDAYNKALPQNYAMPRQVDMIRERSAFLQNNGTATFTYHLPFAEKKIKRLLKINPGPLVEDTLEYMMCLAFENPLRSRHEFEKLVSAYTPKIPEPGTISIADEPRPSGKKIYKRDKAKVNRNNRKSADKNTAKGNKNTKRRRYKRHRAKKGGNTDS